MHNCDTCMQHCHDEFGAHVCAKNQPMRWDNEPQWMRPCFNGTPIVASAIAEVEFEPAHNGSTLAIHDDAVIAWIGKDDMRWTLQEDGFCKHCGLRLPTADQLPLMFERAKEERK